MENKMGQRGREKGVGGELHWSAVFMVITPVRSAPASSSHRRASALSVSVLGSERRGGSVWRGLRWMGFL
jgi:hypothetical protein